MYKFLRGVNLQKMAVLLNFSPTLKYYYKDLAKHS